MNIEDIRQKYQCDASQTFAQWKEWVRKNKPSQAETHIVTAVAPNGSKYERLIGGYTDAQNTAFDLVAHGYKNVKMFKSVNAGPMKLLRNFSDPLHGAKFKDSVDFSQDKLLITANGFGNEKGVIKKDPRNGLKPFEVNFYIKGKDGKLIKTGRSKMAASLNEAKQWANSESRKYKNVAKVEVKEFRDSVDFADAVDEIRNKYQSDAVGAGVVNTNFKFQTNVEKRLATTRKGRAMTLPQYGKPSKVYVGKDGNFFAVFNTSGQKLSKTPFKTASEAESFARKNGWMVERR